jgi:RNA polymerase sigma factor (sigma-70 family)
VDAGLGCIKRGRDHCAYLYHDSQRVLIADVNATAIWDSKGLSVGLQNAPDASDEVSVWTISAQHFRRWRAGEHSALDDLVRSLSPVLWHVVRSYGLDRDQAEDVVQTAWLTLVRRHESIADPQAVAAWLTTTARREAWRVSKAANKTLALGDEVIEARVPQQKDAASQVVVADEQNRIWACVSQLSERCQRLLRIVAFEDRPDYARIAQDLAMPIGSIGPTRQRCLAKLRAALEGDGWSGDDDGD